MEIKEVILHTKDMFKGYDPAETDYQLWCEIAEFMDGEKALVIESYAENGKYVFLGLADKEKNQKLSYKMEQDSMMGIYINDREGFDRAWDAGEYERDESFYLEEEFLKKYEEEQDGEIK